jgi:hypothetical protein
LKTQVPFRTRTHGIEAAINARPAIRADRVPLRIFA